MSVLWLHDHDRRHRVTEVQLAAALQQLHLVNPAAHARVIRLIDRFANGPAMDDVELGIEVSRAMGIPPGVAN